MEEKSKEVKMNAAKGGNGQPELSKPTYEQLNQAFMELSQQNGLLRQKLQQADRYIQTISRLDYLIKVIELANGGTTYNFSSDFIVKCIAEIEELMTIPEEEKETKES